MKQLIPSILLLAGLIACSKPHDTPQPTAPNQPDTTKSTAPVKPADSLLSIHLIYPDTSGQYGANFELIINETGGKLLLDTVAAFNTTIAATLKTTQPRVNVTTITHLLQYNFYDVYVHRAVKPAQWTTVAVPPINSTPGPFPANIVYTNVPPGADTVNINFGALGIGASWNGNYDEVQHLLEISYTGRSGDNYAYLQIPNLGLFSYQPIHTVHDTISLAQMDSTVRARLTKPAQTSMVLCFLDGYMDTADLRKWQELYRWKYRMSADSIQYPPKRFVPMQKYFLYASSRSTIYNESYDFWAFTDTVTTSIPYPTSPIYTINSRQNTNFSISFSQKPTLYTSSWETGNITMYVDAPSDSTTLNALDLANSLNSKLLKENTFTNLHLVGAFDYTMVPGVTYDSFYVHQSDPVQAFRPWSSVLYYHNYQP